MGADPCSEVKLLDDVFLALLQQLKVRSGVGVTELA